ncbi:MAG: Mor transcription activator family protein [Clostridia bacterium]|nr:Mor transcription activator family protein [Clostridia bacterium]
MSIKENLSGIWDVNLLGDDFSGLNDIYREIADEIGIEKTVAIYNLFHGTQIHFPNRLFSKDYIHKAIIKEYNGKNILQLAQKYNYSERSIWRILKSHKQEI